MAAGARLGHTPPFGRGFDVTAQDEPSGCSGGELCLLAGRPLRGEHGGDAHPER